MTQAAIRIAENALSFIFSYVASTFVSIIVSGKLLTKATGYRDGSGDTLTLMLPKHIKLTANNAEVSFGLGAYLATLSLNILFFGEFVHHRLTEVAGFPKESKMQALAFGSALECILFSVLLFVLLVLAPKMFAAGALLTRRQQEEMMRRIEELQENQKADPNE
jgi:hypothetical protein